jgi:hypothetical protein
MSKGPRVKTSDTVPQSEFSTTFVQGMYDRMAVSFHKYGKVADAYPTKIDALASLKVRLERYVETGNTEWLMDAANFAMIEFMRPRHPKAHFKATDEDATGRVKVSGVHSTKHNLDLK